MKSIDESIATKKLLKSNVDDIAQMSELIVESLRSGGKLLLFGNGGSAADAQHIAAEFIGRYLIQRRALPAIALTTNTSSLTAIANDYGYDHVFERQIEALCEDNDVAVGISTSGNSKNVMLGIEAAMKKNAKTIGMTGRRGGKLSRIVDLAIKVPSDSTPRIQESHILIGHIVSEIVEISFSDKPTSMRKRS
ncbi:MAG: D-sedoheptulose 7-phosphate isomerase [Thaumarchaeota archaeon]|nr:D-sedoheptulose 7-phosphate isomerase [Nitrososphaerota archaeon]